MLDIAQKYNRMIESDGKWPIFRFAARLHGTARYRKHDFTIKISSMEGITQLTGKTCSLVPDNEGLLIADQRPRNRTCRHAATLDYLGIHSRTPLKEPHYSIVCGELSEGYCYPITLSDELGPPVPPAFYNSGYYSIYTAMLEPHCAHLELPYPQRRTGESLHDTIGDRSETRTYRTTNGPDTTFRTVIGVVNGLLYLSCIMIVPRGLISYEAKLSSVPLGEDNRCLHRDHQTSDVCLHMCVRRPTDSPTLTYIPSLQTQASSSLPLYQRYEGDDMPHITRVLAEEGSMSPTFAGRIYDAYLAMLEEAGIAP